MKIFAVTEITWNQWWWLFFVGVCAVVIYVVRARIPNTRLLLKIQRFFFLSVLLMEIKWKFPEIKLKANPQLTHTGSGSFRNIIDLQKQGQQHLRGTLPSMHGGGLVGGEIHSMVIIWFCVNFFLAKAFQFSINVCDWT